MKNCLGMRLVQLKQKVRLMLAKKKFAAITVSFLREEVLRVVIKKDIMWVIAVDLERRNK